MNYRKMEMSLHRYNRVGRKMKSKSLFLACCLAISSQGFAFSLGEVTTKSRVGEKLNATIEILDEQPRFGLKDIRVRQLNKQQASILGINLANSDQYFALKPVMKDGELEIQVTSQELMNEPYINFVVEFVWPKGRVFREYTILLNPSSSVQQPQVVSQPVKPRQHQDAVAQRNISTARPAPVKVAAAKPVTVGKVKYVVRDGDSLSVIAERSKHQAGMTRGQMMEWILNNNLDAFVRGNPNLLVSGAELLLPASAQDARKPLSISDSKTSTTKNLSTAATGDVSGPSKKAVAENISRLTVEDGISSKNDIKSVKEVSELRQRLNVAKESFVKLQRENKDLQARLERLEKGDYLKNLERLVKLKDRQIDALNEELEELSAESPKDVALSRGGDRVAKNEADDVPEATFSAKEFFQKNKDHFGWFALFALILAALVAVIWRLVLRDKQEIDFDDPSTYPREIKTDPATLNTDADDDPWGAHIGDDPVTLMNSEVADEIVVAQNTSYGSDFYDDSASESDDLGLGSVDGLIDLAMLKAKSGNFSEAKLLLMQEKERYPNDVRIDEALEFIEQNQV